MSKNKSEEDFMTDKRKKKKKNVNFNADHKQYQV